MFNQILPIDKVKVAEIQFVGRLVNAKFPSIIKFLCRKLGFVRLKNGNVLPTVIHCYLVNDF
jgi:hypothetical protein